VTRIIKNLRFEFYSLKINNKDNLTNLIIKVTNASMIAFLSKTFLNNENLNLQVFLLLFVFGYVVNNLFLALIVIGISFATVATLIKVPLVSTLIYSQGNDLFLAVFILSLIFTTIGLIKLNLDSQLNSSKILFTSISLILLLVVNHFFNSITSLTKPQALRYLVYTGEDNGAWINFLSSGFTEENKFAFFDMNRFATDIRPQTQALLLIFRKLSLFGQANLSVTDSVLILQRLYFVIIFMAVLVASLGVAKVLTGKSFSPISVFAFSSLTGLATYFSLSSFAMVGHLTPIITIWLVLVGIFTALNIDQFSEKTTFSKIISATFFVIIFAGASEAWWPIKPALYMIIGFYISKEIFKIGKTKFSRANLYKGSALIVLLLGLISITQSPISKNLEYRLATLSGTIAELKTNIHMSGGTLAPGYIHFLAIMIALPFFWQTSNPKFALINNAKLKAVLLGLIGYYLMIVMFSLSTSPYSIDYAAQKLGLVVITILLPLEILVFALLIGGNPISASKSLALFSSGLIFIVYAGSPTSSLTVEWNQISFPFAVIDRIKSEDTLVWEGALINQIDQNLTKTNLCFNRFIIGDSREVFICSKFASGLQGSFYDSFARYWMKVNLNSTSDKEFLEILPSDFSKKYKILFIDEMREAPAGSPRNSLSNFVSE
jgi:hypothetical protein